MSLLVAIVLRVAFEHRVDVSVIFPFFSRALGIVIIDDSEKARFPKNELKEFHGVVSHDVTFAETLLFCIREDGTEGLCCPTGGYRSDEEDEED